MVPFYESNGHCVETCPTNEFGNHATVQCEPCKLVSFCNYTVQPEIWAGNCYSVNNNNNITVHWRNVYY